LTGRGGPVLLLPLLAVLAACHPRPPADLPRPAAWSAVYRCRVIEGAAERRFRAALLVGEPDRFRLELYGPVGGPRLLMASDGTALAAALPSDRLHAEAAATPASFAVLIGLPLGGADLVALLDGRLAAGGAPAGSATAVRTLAGGGSARYAIRRGPGGEIESAEVAIAGEAAERISFRVVYGPPADGPAGRLPSEVRLSRPGRALILELREARARALDAAAFRLPPPPAFRRVTIEDLAAAGLVLFGDGDADRRVDTSPQLQ
jgi:hypothetical protein